MQSKLRNRLIILQRFFCTFILCLIVLACNEIGNKQNSNNNEKTNIEGNYHFLEDTGTKIFLPTGFERYSLVKYQNLLDSISKKSGYDIDSPRLKELSKMDGSLYIYHDKENGASCTVNTIPYYEFTKEDGTQLLGLITSTHNKIKEKNDVTFNKVTARSGGNAKQQIFKAIYKVSGKKLKSEIYQTSYIISAKEKTLLIHLTRTIESDFDPYIEKMVIK
jgi:hypothetical protein